MAIVLAEVGVLSSLVYLFWALTFYSRRHLAGRTLSPVAQPVRVGLHRCLRAVPPSLR